jgi:NRAMP (natural resistance-associated macrophage protein)-like metal ion transporter
LVDDAFYEIAEGGDEVPEVLRAWLHGMCLVKSHLARAHHVLTRLKIAVAYIDPGNYSTDVAAGATYRFQLLFIVFMSNIFAIFLQGLCIKLGSVSGLNLAEACKEFLPMWLNIALYIMAEAAVRCLNLFILFYNFLGGCVCVRLYLIRFS